MLCLTLASRSISTVGSEIKARDESHTSASPVVTSFSVIISRINATEVAVPSIGTASRKNPLQVQ